jgi:hypothetical protein
MTKTETLMADLEEASRIAKAGEDMPLVGGPVGLWWGVLLTLTFTLHYLIFTQSLPISEAWIGWLWFTFGLGGSLGSVLIGRRIGKKPGAGSFVNRVEQYAWMMFAFTMLSLAVGVLLNLILNEGTMDLWTMLLIFGFGGQGLVYGLTAKLTGHGWLHFASLGGFTMAAVTMSFYGDIFVYVIAAIGTVVTIIIPSLLSMKAAR